MSPKYVEPTARDDRPTVEDVTRWLGKLVAPGQTFEIRAPKSRVTPRSRTCVATDLTAAAEHAMKFSGRGPGVYFTLNPVRPDLPDGAAASDTDIVRRRLLMIDCDPTRPKEVSATDAEKAKAKVMAWEIMKFLRGRGFPEPVVCDSGNGYHLLYLLDLDAADEDLVKSVLYALAKRFDTAECKVDVTVSNPSRICKLPGTKACKGRNTADRPHRCSRLLTSPDDFAPVPTDLLRQLVADTPLVEAKPLFDLDAAIERKREESKASSPGPGTIPDLNAPLSDDTILTKARDAKTGAKFSALYAGRTDGYKSHNEADLALCSILGFWCGPDPDRIDRLFRGSGLMRADKWDSPRKKTGTYGRGTIAKALSGKTKFYEPRTKPRTFSDGVPGDARTGPEPSTDGAEQPPGSDRTQDPGSGDRRPVVTITTEEHAVIDAAVSALGPDQEIYQRSFMMAHVLRDKTMKGVIRQPGTPTVRPIPQAVLRKHMTKAARWQKWRKTRDGDKDLVPAHPPEWAVAGVFHQGSWPGVRYLEAVVETPVLRPDGTVLDVPGYDVATGLLYEPNASFPSVPSAPTREVARKCAERILEVVSDFPFVSITGDDDKPDGGRAHRAAYLAALLTPLGRFAIDGPCPMFVFDANTSGSGKTKLCDIIAIIASGRMMSRTNYSESDEEMGKQILSIALAADRLVLLDNVPTGGSLGGPSLDRALTATTVSGRILGMSKMSGELPMLTVFYATGNNLGLRGDGLRRVVPCRLESPDDRPEERSGFKVEGDLLRYVMDRRASLVVDALTVLRGYVAAGRPKPSGLTPMDYTSWCETVRFAVHWALGIDPCQTRKGLIAADADTTALTSLLNGWETLCQKAKKTSLTSAEAVAEMESRGTDIDLADLRATMGEWSKDGKIPSPRTLGNRLAKVRGRVSEGKALQCSLSQGNKSWYVKPTQVIPPPGGSGGSGDSISSLRGENCADNCNGPIGGHDKCSTSFSRNGGEESHQSHQSHRNGATPPVDRETGEIE